MCDELFVTMARCPSAILGARSFQTKRKSRHIETQRVTFAILTKIS